MRQHRHLNQRTAILGLALLLSGCQLFAATQNRADNDFPQSSSFASLEDFGDEGGFLITALVEKSGENRVRQAPRVPEIGLQSGRSATSTTLGDLVSRTGITRARVNPAMEFGALYYIPNEFNTEEQTGRSIQKICGTVDGHQVDELIIHDIPDATTRERSKLELKGSVDANLVSILTGLNASAEATYLIDIEIRNPRLRYIDNPDAELVRERLLAGNRCRTELIPQAQGTRIFQVVAAYYGEIAIKQAYRIQGTLVTPQLEAELELSTEREQTRFVFLPLIPFAPGATRCGSGVDTNEGRRQSEPGLIRAFCRQGRGAIPII